MRKPHLAGGGGAPTLPAQSLDRNPECVMKVFVFFPIGSRGWLMSTTSPKTMPSFDLNRTIVQRADH